MRDRSGQDSLSCAARQVAKAIAREDDPSALLTQSADSLSGTAGFSSLHLVHWDGRQVLSRETRGGLPMTLPSWPACLVGEGSCVGCRLKQPQSGEYTLVPLRGNSQCRGAMVLEGAPAEQLDDLVEVAEDLAFALERLSRLKQLSRRDELRRDIEELGLLGSWELDPITGEGDWTEGIARIHDIPMGATVPGKSGVRFYDPACRPILEEALARAISGETGYDLELQLTSARGVRKWVRTLGEPVVENGQVVKLRGFLQDISQRKSAEQALLANQRRADTIFSHMLAGIAVARISDGRLVEVNPAMERLLGWSAAELRAKTLGQLARIPDGFHRGETVEVRVRRKNGEEADFLLTGGPADLDGEACILTVWHDVSELRRLDRQARIMFEMAPVGICQTDPRSGRILVANDRFCQMTGYSLAELRARTIMELSHPDDNQRQKPIYRAVSRGELGEYEVDKRYLRKDGSITWVHAHATILRDQTGLPTLAVAVIEDVTHKREAEIALRASQQLYTSLVNHLEDVVFSLDQEARIAFVNPSVHRLGYAPEELFGQPLARFLSREDRSFLRKPEGKKEWKILDRHGKVHWFRVNMNFQTLSGVAVDVTLHKTAEEQLQAAQKMEAIGRLAGGIAHDFNNLLTVILSYTELALEQIDSESPARPDLAEVLDAGNRAKSLTQQLLAFSRRQMMTLEILELNPLVASVERMLARLLGENIRIDLQPDPTGVRVRADRSQLEQVLLNLAVNSRDAMPEGGTLTLACSTWEIDRERAQELDVQAGAFARLTVSDTGTGMSEEVQSRIFEPFFTTKKQGEGTGLGLSMVYGIVRQSQGAIELTSAPDQGTTFAIYLPACIESKVTQPLSQPAPARGGHETLLVVEDEPSLLNLAGRTLRASGYQVLCAKNGQEAISLCQHQGENIDLVLSDVMMPGLNGPDLLQRLRPLCPRARFLLMSGYPNDALAGRGIYEYLPKPFDAPTLREVVRSLLDTPLGTDSDQSPV
jgi:two-component system cell cycle sensor histidine kinase/response regulator CckA